MEKGTSLGRTGGCARLRLSVFPVISDAEWANEWQEVPEFTKVEDREPLRN